MAAAERDSMTWDDSKSNFTSRPGVAADEKISASEWNAHVNDQKSHSARHEVGGGDEIDVNGLLEGAAILYDDDQDAQALIDNHDVVYVFPGTYVNQSYPLDPNGTSILGPGRGADNPADGNVPKAHFDAAGGDAFEIPSSASSAAGTELKGFTVTGTVTFAAGNNREFALENLIVRQADSAVSSGRGIEILTDSFLWEAEDVYVIDCDGAGWYSEHDGQSNLHNINIINCNQEGVDEYNAFFSSAGGGGGAGTYENVYVLGNQSPAGTDNIWFDGVYRAQIENTLSEAAPRDGIRFNTTSDQIITARVEGGASYGSGRDGIRGEGAGGQIIGLSINGVMFNSNTGDDINFTATGVKFSEIGTVFGGGSNKLLNNVSISPAGEFENYLSPYWHTRNGGPKDVTTLSVPAFAIELDDGTNTSSGNIGIAVHWKGTWYYMN